MVELIADMIGAMREAGGTPDGILLGGDAYDQLVDEVGTDTTTLFDLPVRRSALAPSDSMQVTNRRWTWTDDA